jgi:hypothetical protein
MPFDQGCFGIFKRCINYYYFFLEIFVFIQCLMNSKIIKIPPKSQKISGLGYGYLDIFYLLYTVELHMYS